MIRTPRREPVHWNERHPRGGLAVGVLAVAAFLFVAASGLYFDYVFATRGVYTEALVAKHSGTSQDPQYVVRFTTADGQQEQAETLTRRSDVPVGGKVDIVYDPQDPESVQEDVRGYYELPAILGITSAFLIAFIGWDFRRWTRWHAAHPGWRNDGASRA